MCDLPETKEREQLTKEGVFSGVRCCREEEEDEVLQQPLDLAIGK